MPTEIVSTIRASGGDYSTLTAWEAGEQADIVSADEIAVAECYDDWSSGLNDAVVVSGWTTDTTRRIIIRAASGHEGNGRVPDTAAWSGFFLKSNSNAPVVGLDANNIDVEGIGVYNTRTTSNAFVSAVYVNTGNNCNVRRVTGRGADRRTFRSSSDNWRFENCIGYINNSTTVFNLASASGGNIEVYNCTAVALSASGSTGFGNSTDTRTIDTRNCVAFGFGTSYTSGFSHASSSNNAASDGSTVTPPGSNPITTDIVAGDFEDEPNDNYALASGSTLIDAGADLSSVYTVDILGNTRDSSFDIGAFEFVSGGGVTITGSLESISFSSFSASISSDVSIPGSLESIDIATGVADVSINANIIGISESIILTAQQSDIQSDSSIAGALESIGLTEFAANVSTGSSIGATTEMIGLTTFVANVGLDASISAGLESLILSSFQSAVTTGSAISAQAESMTLSTFVSTITSDTSIVGSVESITVVANAAGVALGSSVSAALETITLQANPATITTDVTLTGSLESIILTELASQINVGKNIDAGLESLTITPSGAVITLDTGATAVLESITLTAYSATLTIPVGSISSTGHEYTLPINRIHYTFEV